MSATQYIGSRYVPIFANPIEWSNTKTYEPLTIVTHEGNSYTSRQFVPIGIDIANDKFWALTGNYNAQVEQYRRETAHAVDQVDEWLTDAQNKYSTKPFAFDTVADMQAAYELLYVGAICHTNGFHESDDGGAAWYAISDTGAANGMDTIKCGNLIANLIIENEITLEQFGATSYVADEILSRASSYNKVIRLLNKVYDFTIRQLDNNYNFVGDSETILQGQIVNAIINPISNEHILSFDSVNFDGTVNILTERSSEHPELAWKPNQINFINCGFSGKHNYMHLLNVSYATIDNCKFIGNNSNIGIDWEGGINNRLINCSFRNVGTAIHLHKTDTAQYNSPLEGFFINNCVVVDANVALNIDASGNRDALYMNISGNMFDQINKSGIILDGVSQTFIHNNYIGCIANNSNCICMNENSNKSVTALTISNNSLACSKANQTAIVSNISRNYVNKINVNNNVFTLYKIAISSVKEFNEFIFNANYLYTSVSGNSVFSENVINDTSIIANNQIDAEGYFSNVGIITNNMGIYKRVTTNQIDIASYETPKAISQTDDVVLNISAYVTDASDRGIITIQIGNSPSMLNPAAVVFRVPKTINTNLIAQTFTIPIKRGSYIRIFHTNLTFVDTSYYNM